MASVEAWWLELRLLCINFSITEAGCYDVKSSKEARKVCMSKVSKENQETLSIIGRSRVPGLGSLECLQSY